MYKLRLAIKSLLLIAGILVAGFLALPEINLNLAENNIHINFVDEFLEQNGFNFSDFKKGEGLYSTKLVKVSFSSEESEENISKAYNQIKDRLSISQLNDINLTLAKDSDGSYLQFEFPEYYSNPAEYTNWLTGKGDIYFTTGGSTQSTINISDYDILGEVKVEYNTTYKEHLSFSLDPSTSAVITNEFSGENQYFVMYVDGAPSFYVVDFDSYVDTNINRVRAISTLSFTTADTRLISDYVNVVRSYFAGTKVNTSFNIDSNITELAPKTKPTSLSIIALYCIFITIVPITLIGLIKKENRKRLILNILTITVTAIFSISLLKFSGAVLSFTLVLGYIGSILLSQVFVSTFGTFMHPRRYILLLVILMALFTKLTFLNYNLGVFAGTAVITFTSLLIATYYYDFIGNINLSNKVIKRRK